MYEHAEIFAKSKGISTAKMGCGKHLNFLAQTSVLVAVGACRFLYDVYSSAKFVNASTYVLRFALSVPQFLDDCIELSYGTPSAVNVKFSEEFLSYLHTATLYHGSLRTSVRLQAGFFSSLLAQDKNYLTFAPFDSFS